MFYKLILLLLFVSPLHGAQSIKVIDDAGVVVELKHSAKRVVSLSPHITELLYAVGGEGKIIAAVDYSNYPDKAKKLPRVGSGYQLDLESIVGLKPDLIVGWQSGNNLVQLQQLKNMGFTVYLSEPKGLEGIAENLLDLGLLLGESERSKNKAELFLNGINRLTKKNRHSKKVTVFYQVWQQPLFTINGDHIISHIIEICGGKNIFKELEVLSPQVDIESVIVKNPDVIIAGVGGDRKDWLSNWHKWDSIEAVKNKQLYGIEADLIVRHTLRILQGAEMMCDILQKTREAKP